MTAAGSILVAAVFYLRGVVRVTGPGTVLQIGIISGTGVMVVYHRGNRSAAGMAVHQTGKKFGAIFFLSGGGPVILTGCPSVQKDLQSFQVYRKTRWNTVQGHADGRSVGLAEKRKL